MAEALLPLTVMTSEVRTALARALVASAIALGPRERVPAGRARDRLVAALTQAWGGDERALGWLTSRVKRAALHVATNTTKRKRGAISDASYPAAGDILLYQRRGGGIRTFIRDVIAGAASPVVLLAHSLGGIACFDLLCEPGAPAVEWLITVGSQAPLLYEIDALAGIRHRDSLPAGFPKKWPNIYDLRDFLSYTGEGLFGKDRVTDIKVDNGNPFPESHSSYFTNPQMWDAIIPRLR
jgi:hypothetical protein